MNAHTSSRRHGNAFCCLLRMPNGIAKEERQ
ncbi:hypothetical protein T4B_1417 [Trichinella pseudospiralis]|uniref:Uncharacterized protein n=1 Tax=Trichinella pseudospiralis TaxID=6337 RepID=A0A0V1GBY7_TRIPS|nr:hypothetical protein T4B_1557 [Trichinella pseudospiralis]KRY95796.1 hypothetical protein T4B_14819 [Trichinella pseudospiralis]KRY95798.1 hypothetical protein T4B_8081 [Trichinella pseudospiralis]KRY97324.1 hypothetical protein T4C_2064 [Trichinella pseudospiralis]KRY97336.1 hypothetical protein T4C_13515 [Trichinella pseudospiralis]